MKTIGLCVGGQRAVRKRRDKELPVVRTERLPWLKLDEPLHLELAHQLRGSPFDPVLRQGRRRVNATVFGPTHERRHVRRSVDVAVAHPDIPLFLAVHLHVLYQNAVWKKKALEAF